MNLAPQTLSRSLTQDPVVSALTALLAQHGEKRISVVGTTCTGKSTLVAAIAGAQDMDHLVFPTLTLEEEASVCQTPWTPEIGDTMTRLVRERVVIEAGKPVFGTIVIDCDLVILLTISDELLSRRTALRGVDFADAKNMQARIKDEVRSSGLPWLEVSVG